MIPRILKLNFTFQEERNSNFKCFRLSGCPSYRVFKAVKNPCFSNKLDDSKHIGVYIDTLF